MMSFRKKQRTITPRRRVSGSTIGAVAVTVVAAASALVVNAGLLRQPSSDGVGTLTADQAAVATLPASQGTVHYVTVYVDDPASTGKAPAATLADRPTSVEQSTLVATAPVSTRGEHHEYEGADDDD